MSKCLQTLVDEIIEETTKLMPEPEHDRLELVAVRADGFEGHAYAAGGFLTAAMVERTLGGMGHRCLVFDRHIEASETREAALAGAASMSELDRYPPHNEKAAAVANTFIEQTLRFLARTGLEQARDRLYHRDYDLEMEHRELEKAKGLAWSVVTTGDIGSGDQDLNHLALEVVMISHFRRSMHDPRHPEIDEYRPAWAASLCHRLPNSAPLKRYAEQAGPPVPSPVWSLPSGYSPVRFP